MAIGKRGLGDPNWLAGLLNHWWFWLSGTVVAGILALLVFCATLRVWSIDGWRVYQAMARECHPAWKDYHFGRVKAGDPIEDVIARTDPTDVKREGRWVVLTYQTGGRGLHFTGMAAVAYDGRMVCACASSCTWTRLFFDELSDEQSRELNLKPRDDPRRWGMGVVVR